MYLESFETDDENDNGKEYDGNTENQSHYGIEQVEFIFSREALKVAIVVVHLPV